MSIYCRVRSHKSLGSVTTRAPSAHRFCTTKAHMFFLARPAGFVHALSDRYTFGSGGAPFSTMVEIGLFCTMVQNLKFPQLAKRTRTGWCRRSRQLARRRGSAQEVLEIIPKPLPWRVPHQRIERHDVLSLGLTTVIITAVDGSGRDQLVLDSTLVPFWLATMDASRLRDDVRPKVVRSRYNPLSTTPLPVFACVGPLRGLLLKSHTSIPPRPFSRRAGQRAQRQGQTEAPDRGRWPALRTWQNVWFCLVLSALF